MGPSVRLGGGAEGSVARVAGFPASVEGGALLSATSEGLRRNRYQPPTARAAMNRSPASPSPISSPAPLPDLRAASARGGGAGRRGGAELICVGGAGGATRAGVAGATRVGGAAAPITVGPTLMVMGAFRVGGPAGVR